MTMQGVLLDWIYLQGINLVLSIAIFLPGFATFYLLLQLAYVLDWPWLWDPAPIVAGVIGGFASYPLHLALSSASKRIIFEMNVALYRTAMVGIAIACTCMIILIWAEGTERVDPPEPLAPIGERFDGTKYEE
jgi:hypothetical protein